MRVALLTPPGRGALAVVAVAGPGAAALVAERFRPRGGLPLTERPDGAVVFGRFADRADAPPEDLVVVRHAADSLEIHCHGGLAAPEAVIASLERGGARRQTWPAWLRDGGETEIAVEARERLAACGSPKGAAILARQLGGLLAAGIGHVKELVAAGRTAEAGRAVDRLQAAARVGLRLTEPWRVVLAGQVNAGKSSLVNALVGYGRSLVSPEPGTTRDLLETRIVLDGWEIDLVDTAGTRDDSPGSPPASPSDGSPGSPSATSAAISAIEREGIARAEAARATADLVLHVVDATASGDVPPTEHAITDARPSASGPAAGPPVLRVVTKVDLVGESTAATGATLLRAGWLRTSAVTGDGIDRLAAAIVRRLVPEEQDDPELLAGAVPFTLRQLDEIGRLRPSE